MVAVRLALWVPILVSASANAQETPAPTTLGGATPRRVALVIGNGAYVDAPLRNPVNDARAMEAALKKLDFEVIPGINLARADLMRAVGSFGDGLRATRGVGLFFFAGHGLQVDGRNYLIPVGATIDRERDVQIEGVDVNFVLEEMQAAGSPLTIVILDACRNNPFSRSFRSQTRGLAEIRGSRGMYIAYATEPGSVAADGDGANGVYTQELLKQIGEPGLGLHEVFMRVRRGVVAATGGKQVPWESGSLMEDFYFRPAAPVVAGPDTAEERLWEAVKGSSSRDSLGLYLKLFPAGLHAKEARSRLEALETGGGARPAPGEPASAPNRPAAAPSPDESKEAALSIAFQAGVTASRAGRHDEAIAEFNKALRVVPACYECYYNIGHAYFQKKDYSGAEAAFKKAIELKSDHADAYSALAVYNMQRRFTEAAATSAEAAKYSVGNASAEGNAVASYNSAVILWNQGKIAEAKKLFETAVKLDPMLSQAHYQLALTNLNEGKLNEAAAELRQYLKLAPSGEYASQARAILAQLK